MPYTTPVPDGAPMPEAFERAVPDAQRTEGVLYQTPALPASERRAPDEEDARLLLGLSSPEQDWWQALFEADTEGARREYDAFLAGDAPLDIEYRVRLPGGGQRWLRDRARVVARDAQGRPSQLIGVLDDVTGRNSLRRRAREAAEKYRLLFDSIDAGFCVIQMLFDAQGRPQDYLFLEVNAAFARQTGIQDAPGRRMREIAPAHEEHWFQTYGRIARSGVPERFEHSAAQLGFYYDVYAFRFGDPALHQVAVLFNDISSRKQMEDALREDGRRKTEFIAMLAHELRNPLATITSGLQAMKLGSHGVAMHPAAPMMERQIVQMSQLLDDLLDINRIALGKVVLRKERCDLGQLAAHVAEAFRAHYLERDVRLELELPQAPVRVRADATRMAQVLGNLLSNAAKFSHPGSQVRLRVGEQDGRAMVEVRDTGIGIEPDKLQHIFELFAQVDSNRHASFGGLGVGIALARELVGRHDGVIEAHSAGLGQGSTFTVRLPLDAPAPAVVHGVEDKPARDGALQLLLIDDNRDAADSISMVLELLGHQVTTRYNGADGLAAAEQARPDVIITDIGMPGMDGHEVCRRLRARADGAALRIVALTGWGTTEDRELTRQAGFDHHLVKPVTAAKLREALAAVTERA